MLPRCVQAPVLVFTSLLLLMITVEGSQLPACPDDGVVHHIHSTMATAPGQPAGHLQQRSELPVQHNSYLWCASTTGQMLWCLHQVSRPE